MVNGKLLMRIRPLLFILGLFVTGTSLSQIKPISIAHVDSLLTHDAKPVLVLLSTEWCQYCQMQKLQIRKNKKFLQKEHLFYYVEFDAESKNPIQFQGNEYVFKPTGANVGTHELAETLNGPNKLAFPTWILLDKNYKVLFRHGGVLRPQQINELLDTLEKELL